MSDNSSDDEGSAPFEFPISPEMRRQIAAVSKQFQAFSAQLEPVQEALRQFSLQFASFRPQLDQAFKAIQPITRAFADFLETWVPNFKGAKWSVSRLRKIVSDDGIPLMWVPRADAISALMACETIEQRHDYLLENASAVVDDCSAVISDCNSESLGRSVSLAGKCIDAWRDGHVETAQALAVITAEWLITVNVGKYKSALTQAKIEDETALYELRHKCALAPIDRFYVSWFDTDAAAGPAPTHLARHVTVHHGPASEQFSDLNALVSIMLVSSLLREFEEREKEEAEWGGTVSE